MRRSFIRFKPFRDLTGQTFGRLRVLAFKGFTEKAHRSQFLCICECGQIVIRLGNSLLMRQGDQSCGCARHESLVRRNRLGKGKPWSAARRAAHEAAGLLERQWTEKLNASEQPNTSFEVCHSRSSEISTTTPVCARLGPYRSRLRCDSWGLDLTDCVGEFLRIGHRGYSIRAIFECNGDFSSSCCA
jgi:hypothetical protein